MNRIPASFESGRSATGPAGQVAHTLAHDQVERLKLSCYAVGDRAWSVVGNGLSNQGFIQGPEGLIVIDTGESVEEMQDALAMVRQHTSAPVVACLYTHFHYCAGTSALVPETRDGRLDIYGHVAIETNLRRTSGEVGPRGQRGMVHQFGILLPEDGPDGIVSVGLGRFFRNPAHAPFTQGHLPANHTFDAPTSATIAGLDIEFYPAPSDANDSVTIWIPSLKLCVNNLLWPALFNVFAIRGEEYRDPRVLLTGLDKILSLGPDHLMGTHGPPLSGQALIGKSLVDYRDSIQFLWDQTVRGANRGLSMEELIAFVKLPDRFQDSYLTRQLYGVVEHHVRQIYTGLFGWYDENDANLFPVPAPERAQKLIAGFGGIDAVRAAIDAALADSDFRWAVELATWLTRSALNVDGRADAGEPQDRARQAAALRGIGYGTTSANIRNWCITRALELEGTLDLSRFRGVRLRVADILASPPDAYVPALRVLLDPAKAASLDECIRFEFDDGTVTGLALRGGVAVPTMGDAPTVTVKLDLPGWASLLGGKAGLSELLRKGALRSDDDARLMRCLACFDVPAFSR